MEQPQRRGVSRARRGFVDAATTSVVRAGGVFVMAIITLLFVYLLWVSLPLLAPTSVLETASSERLRSPPVAVFFDEQARYLAAASASGGLHFYAANDGRAAGSQQLAAGPLHAVTVRGERQLYAVLGDDATLRLYRFETAPQGPALEQVAAVDARWADAASHIDLRLDGAVLSVLATVGSRVVLRRYELDGATPVPVGAGGADLARPVRAAYLALGGRNVFVFSDGALHLMAVGRSGHLAQLVMEPTEKVQTSALVAGGASVLAAQGRSVNQWMILSTPEGARLEMARSFDLDEPAQHLLADHRARTFIAVSEDGEASLHQTTTERLLERFVLAGSGYLAYAPTGQYLASANDQHLTVYRVNSPHPQASLRSLWRPVWYEGYAEPAHIWQSSAADNDFEPKFALSPLLFGTIKAALFAMLFAAPLALAAAVYTAYYLPDRARQVVKPIIETMAAVPAVVLGFIAGIWLAPLAAQHLAAMLLAALLLPATLLAVGRFVDRAGADALGASHRVWLAVMAVLLACSLAAWLGPALEAAFFGGQFVQWLFEAAAVDFDQRNALVVGFAMAFAVIPVIFAIAEDALSGVPAGYAEGAMALGATRWQTLTRVVLLAASPGLFSAVVIGFGRAVGETMIVLMATGNTPIMDWNVFEGMRTFAANIAIELPESEVGGTHYRILFLTALVLFGFTFALNTVAELVRQRLRQRYAAE